MIETVFIGSAFSIAVFFVWLVASYNEGRKAQAKIQETQRQLKMSEDRSSQLRVEMSKLKDEMSYLHKNIDQESRSAMISPIDIPSSYDMFESGLANGNSMASRLRNEMNGSDGTSFAAPSASMVC